MTFAIFLTPGSVSQEVESQRKTSSLQRNVVYPLAMLLLLALTTITVLMVLQNTLELLIGIKALPLSTRVSTSTVLNKGRWQNKHYDVLMSS